jgi:hypothetical protein
MPERALAELTRLLFGKGKGAHAISIACVEELTRNWRRAPSQDSIPSGNGCFISAIGSTMISRESEGVVLPYPARADGSWAPAPADDAPDGSTRWLVSAPSSVSWPCWRMPVRMSYKGKVQAMRPAHEQPSSSVLAVLWQTVVAHNNYHLGQIASAQRPQILAAARRRRHLVGSCTALPDEEVC